MSVIIKGHRIPKKYGSLQMLTEKVTALVMDGELVWSAFDKYRTFFVSGVFIVPAGVTSVRLCGVGGGGGGSASNTLGGSSGEIISGADVPVTQGQSIDVTIGTGGITDTDGTETRFGTVSLHGGTQGSYQGQGEERVTCGGVTYNGIQVNTFYGGQASPFSDGGDGEGQDGEYGSGGGAGVTGGTGGAGRLLVRWSEGD